MSAQIDDYTPEEREDDEDVQIKNYIADSRSRGDSDYTILENLKNVSPRVKDYYAMNKKEGIKDKESNNFISTKFDLKPVKDRTWLQSAMRYMSGGVLPWIGDKLDIDELKDVGNIGPGIAAGLMSAPRMLIDALPAVSQAQLQFDYPNANHKETPVQKSWGEPITESDFTVQVPGWEDGGETVSGDITPFLRYIFPSLEDAEELFIAEKDQPKSGFGKRALRSSEFTGAGALGGPVGAALGGVLGEVDYELEENKFSPLARLGIESAIGLLHEGYKTINPSKRAGAQNWAKNTFQKAKSGSVTNASDLAARILFRDPANVNFQVLQDMQSLGFDLAEVPIQSYMTGGLPNWLEGSMENSMFTQKFTNETFNKFNQEMVKRAETILDGVPIEEVNDAVSMQSLGEPEFVNPLKNVMEESAPNLDLTKREKGKIGSDYVKEIETTFDSAITEAYDAVNFTDNDVVTPDSASYGHLKNAISSTKSKLKAEGFSPQRDAALAVIEKVEELFGTETKVVPGYISDVTTKKIQVPKNIKMKDLRTNLQELNKKINYENPEVINLVTPVANAIRDIFHHEAITNPKANNLLLANELFAEKSNLYKDPLIKRLQNTTSNEQFYNIVRNPENLGKFRDFSQKTGNMKAYNEVRQNILSDVIGPALEAETPKELHSKINDKMINGAKELQEFFPEYPRLAEGLETMKENAGEMLSKDSQAKTAIREEALNFQLSGDPPAKILKQMETQKGNNLVKEVLTQTENGKAIYKSVLNKKVEQILFNGVKASEVDMGTLGRVLDNENNAKILKNLLPEESYAQLEKLSRITKSLEEGRGWGGEMKNLDRHLMKAGGGLGAILALQFLGPAYGVLPLGTVFGLRQIAKGLTSKSFKQSLINEINKKK